MTNHKWVHDIKLDGYRAVAVKSDRVNLYPRCKKSFNSQCPYIVEALRGLTDGMAVDGEVVALDDAGRPQCHLLNSSAAKHRIRYLIFDLLVFRAPQTLECGQYQTARIRATVRAAMKLLSGESGRDKPTGRKRRKMARPPGRKWLGRLKLAGRRSRRKKASPSRYIYRTGKESSP
jgi:ATP dependent DNA ligase domain